MTGGLEPALLAHAIVKGFGLGGRRLPAWRPAVRCVSLIDPLPFRRVDGRLPARWPQTRPPLPDLGRVLVGVLARRQEPATRRKARPGLGFTLIHHRLSL